MTTMVPSGQAQGNLVGPHHMSLEWQVKNSGSYVAIVEKLSLAPILFHATQVTSKIQRVKLLLSLVVLTLGRRAFSPLQDLW